MMLDKFLQAVDPRSDMIPNANPVAGNIPGTKLGLFDLISNMFGRNEFLTGLGIFGFLATLWTVYSILAYVISIVFLAFYVYASVQKKQYLDLQTEALRDKERLYDEQFRGRPQNSRLSDILRHTESDNPNDWKLAIIEADIILDDILKQRGYVGTTLGERLKNISSQQLVSLNDAWEAHKVRNRIAHDGADFVLTKRAAEETISRYRRVFSEFDIY